MKLLKGKDITIYINKEELKINDLTKTSIEKLIKNINKNYDINLKGYYNVGTYIDKNYGIIINIDKEELEYLDYFNELEINIEIIKDSFLYKIEDLSSIKNIINRCIMRKLNENIYIEIKELSNIEMGIILENAIIIYGKEAKKIKNQSKIVNTEVIV